ncbi:unnamed protein product [Lampetra planeri]
MLLATVKFRLVCSRTDAKTNELTNSVARTSGGGAFRHGPHAWHRQVSGSAATGALTHGGQRLPQLALVSPNVASSTVRGMLAQRFAHCSVNLVAL